ncbi:MAG: bifunctional diaminohydroxyphosphoribosylaminopyrimidine deaminase/5-amino-6-(5-phosphoribosylamino)uracil reductase RibD [Deltaproteobacteria bacterium]|nr:bifunctional diaminohydroxyphosphoribosylaminopyrimidine deaminase/5-amino-6-(5-phosphoribosylamino)uracil reductase RibD [Deltaproteobacteria bacterium]
MTNDTRFMDKAIALAERGRGKTAPNPCVGAVLVRDGRVVAKGWHTACGKAHAEVEALRDAATKGVDPAECTLYVTLEPCNHHGKTPPCTQAILAAGIKTVVIGCLDPNQSVTGGGKEFLEGRGVHVRAGIRRQACTDLIADFRIWQDTDRPFSIVKLAVTLDGKIATRTGHSAWISGERSRAEVHKLRAWCGAVMIGGATYRADNPRLTCRMDGHVGPQPLAVVVSRTLPDEQHQSALLATRPGDVVFWTTEAESRSRRATCLADLGVSVWGLPGRDDGLDLTEGMRLLRREKGCLYVLTEGGGHLAASLRAQGLLDELRLFQAMKILGDEQARSGFAGHVAMTMDDAWNFRLVEHRMIGQDHYLRLRPKE